MLDFLYRLSDVYIFLVLVGITIAISVISIVINKHLILYKLRYKDNATIGSISSLIGIIYGVLVGFIALYLINNNDHASDAAQREASAVANVYRDSQWLKGPAQLTFESALKKYITETVNVEWPLMREGKDINLDGDFIIQDMSNKLRAYNPVTPAETMIVQDLLTELKGLYNARHERISMSGSQLSPELWEVILVGTILIIAINYAFRVNFYLHLFAISAFAIMAASMLFLLVTLDRPFQGEFIVEPDALKAVLAFMEKNSPELNKTVQVP